MVFAYILRPSGATQHKWVADPQAYAMWLLSYAPPGLALPTSSFLQLPSPNPGCAMFA